ncbi:hypothetical protein FRC08_018809 [Ceratobasidium sp. 394]|nr:hypothetical protein FRC08_018809 [Ceratobasidium sp. 394]
MDLGSQLGEPSGAGTALPSGIPHALLEVEDADVPSAPISETHSPRRTPSVTLEEVEDVNMPRPPRWGPHPYAKPTRPSRYPRPHPNPTAGVPLRVVPVDKKTPPLYTSKLAEPDTFEEAYWLDNASLTQRDEAQYFKLPRTKGWIWNSIGELNAEIHALPGGPKWY